jgi:hypothetical protein
MLDQEKSGNPALQALPSEAPVASLQTVTSTLRIRHLEQSAPKDPCATSSRISSANSVSFDRIVCPMYILTNFFVEIL